MKHKDGFILSLIGVPSTATCFGSPARDFSNGSQLAAVVWRTALPIGVGNGWSTCNRHDRNCLQLMG